MSWRSPVGPLVHEHRVIERLIAVMRGQSELIGERGAIDPSFVDAATDFIRTYADRCHHGKEERILFRGLAGKQMDPAVAAEMEELIREHVHGRGLTGRLVEANERYASGDTSALTEIEGAMRELAEFYPRHIAKEDHDFFRKCLVYLTAEEQRDMLAEYDEFDKTLIHEKYLSVVERLEGEYR